MPDMYDNYRMVEEVKERAVSRGSGSTEFESYDRVAKIEYRDGREKILLILETITQMVNN